MHVQRDSFFRIFSSELRGALQYFFENRRARITPEIASEFVDLATLERLVAMGLIEFDGESGEYRLDDRTERYLDEMLGVTEAAQADWLVGLLEEIRRAIDGYQSLSDPAKGDALLRRVSRLLRTCKSRIQRHLEEVGSAVDYDYRAGADYELKLLKLKWHLERARSYAAAVTELNNLLRHDSFFQIHQEIELITLRRQVIQKCNQVGDGLIDIYQRIEEYLNRVQRDYARARKLLQLCSLIERHEHLTATNVRAVAESATGPWFHEMRLRTLLDPRIVDDRPELLKRALDRAGITGSAGKTKTVETDGTESEDVPPIIDWQNVYEAFTKQQTDLFAFLAKIRVEGRPLTEEERVDGFCSILTNEEWADALDADQFATAVEGNWEYALIKPPAAIANKT
jgi:hypothetical protein